MCQLNRDVNCLLLFLLVVGLLPREDDDINDVTSMAGVNLREENAKILTSVVGSVEKSCQDQPFLSPSPVLSRILHTGTGSMLGQSQTEDTTSRQHIRITHQHFYGRFNLLEAHTTGPFKS